MYFTRKEERKSGFFTFFPPCGEPARIFRRKGKTEGMPGKNNTNHGLTAARFREREEKDQIVKIMKISGFLLTRSRCHVIIRYEKGVCERFSDLLIFLLCTWVQNEKTLRFSRRYDEKRRFRHDFAVSGDNKKRIACVRRV